MLGCAAEARTLPAAQAALAQALSGSGPCTVIAGAGKVHAQGAAFANAVAAHALVREDMHAGAVSHFGVVVWPALLAAAEQGAHGGARLLDAAILGYQLGARIGRMMVDPVFTHRFRPTGFTGPLAATAAISHLIGLDEGQTASALALAANCASGLNEWPKEGADDMVCHAGTAAATAVRCSTLAAAGAYGASTALDGLLAGFSALQVAKGDLLGGDPEILDVYFKALPVCNFAQTACQAALQIVRQSPALDPNGIVAVTVRTSAAARSYPGCDAHGPFERELQAKMSIQYGVAAALAAGRLSQASFDRLDDPLVARLAQATTIVEDAGFTATFPARQGAAVMVTLRDGAQIAAELQDVAAATPDEVRTRSHAALAQWRGIAMADAMLNQVGTIETSPAVGALFEG